MVTVRADSLAWVTPAQTRHHTRMISSGRLPMLDACVARVVPARHLARRPHQFNRSDDAAVRASRSARLEVALALRSRERWRQELSQAAQNRRGLTLSSVRRPDGQSIMLDGIPAGEARFHGDSGLARPLLRHPCKEVLAMIAGVVTTKDVLLHSATIVQDFGLRAWLSLRERSRGAPRQHTHLTTGVSRII